MSLAVTTNYIQGGVLIMDERILIVDDDEKIRNLISIFIEELL